MKSLKRKVCLLGFLILAGSLAQAGPIRVALSRSGEETRSTAIVQFSPSGERAPTDYAVQVFYPAEARLSPEQREHLVVELRPGDRDPEVTLNLKGARHPYKVLNQVYSDRGVDIYLEMGSSEVSGKSAVQSDQEVEPDPVVDVDPDTEPDSEPAPEAEAEPEFEDEPAPSMPEPRRPPVREYEPQIPSEPIPDSHRRDRENHGRPDPVLVPDYPVNEPYNDGPQRELRPEPGRNSPDSDCCREVSEELFGFRSIGIFGLGFDPHRNLWIDLRDLGVVNGARGTVYQIQLLAKGREAWLGHFYADQLRIFDGHSRIMIPAVAFYSLGSQATVRLFVYRTWPETSFHIELPVPKF